MSSSHKIIPFILTSSPFNIPCRDDFGYGDESLYEDVGQGAPVTKGAVNTSSSGYALSTGVSHAQPVTNIPPPSMRAPPPPGVPYPQEGKAVIACTSVHGAQLEFENVNPLVFCQSVM